MKRILLSSILFFTVTLLLSGQIVWGQVPQTISYQAVLTDASGKVVPNGNYNLTFRLYDNENAAVGSAIWTESHQNLPVSNGITNVILGSSIPLNKEFDRQYWLGVTVGTGTELAPRIQLTSSAYSLNARTVTDSVLTSQKIADGQVVRSINLLNDDVTLAPGANVTITPAGNTLTISASGGGLSLPFAGSVASSTPAFSATNSGTGIAVRGLSTNTEDIINYGGYFEAYGKKGRGVTGAVSGSDAYGVYGFATGIGTGVYGESDGNGNGLIGKSANGTGVSGFGSGAGNGVSGTSNGTGAAVRGVSLTSPGVDGFSGSGYGVLGMSTSGRAGYFEISNANNSSTALAAHTTGSGEAFVATTYGTGEAAFIGINNVNNNRPAIEVRTNGTSWTGYFAGKGNNAKGVFIGVDSKDSQHPALEVDGWTKTKVLEITGGADLSENFEVRAASPAGGSASPEQAQPGMVVSIDPDNPGELVVTSRAYDRRVAGIISGAGGVRTGMLMSQTGSVADGGHPVALTGRVYCLADASNGAIEIGDLLTTSETPGHAMKVTDYANAQGAIIGKAMTALADGKGLVLVLVTLQ